MNLSAEWNLFLKLKSLGIECHAFDGLTTHESRRENMRAAIERGGKDIVYTVQDGKIVTLKQMWMRVYGENWE